MEGERKLSLSKREINIILTLMENEASSTTNDLARKFKLSVRTIKYDLDNIKEWLEKRGEKLYTKRNKGIWLDLHETKKRELKNELLYVEKYNFYPDQEMRISKIISLLCYKNDYVTTQQLANTLGVSKNTIVNDLDETEKILNNYKLNLIRKNYFGFAIEGKERDIRLLLEAVIQKGLTDYDIYNITQIVSNQYSEEKIAKLSLAMLPEMQEIYKLTLTKVTNLLKESNGDEFNYSDILSITSKVAISTFRMILNQTINSYKLLSNQKLLLNKNELPYLLMKKVFDHYELPILEDEYVYIFSDILMNFEEQNISELTQKIIRTVSEEEKMPYDKDKQLYTNLFAHLTVKMHKKYLFVNEYNPFIDDIKAKHFTLYKAIIKACEKEISKSVSIINDSFISFIALHFLTSYEKLNQNNNLVRIVYVCSTGLGITSLIQQRLMDIFSNIEISSFASVLNAREVIREKNPDLVVSIFPLEDIIVPFVKVNPIPNESDIQAIKKVIKKIAENKNKSDSPPRLVARNKKYNSSTVEESSKEILLKAFVVYEDLKELFIEKIKKSYEEAFLLHVFMMVHRIHFSTQYDTKDISETRDTDLLNIHEKEIQEIEAVIAKNDLIINKAEVIALLHYFSL